MKIDIAFDGPDVKLSSPRPSTLVRIAKDRKSQRDELRCKSSDRSMQRDMASRCKI